jgi:hypothetical protein
MARQGGRAAHGRTGRIEGRKPVTLDERIEALTQSVEVLASMHKDSSDVVFRQEAHGCDCAGQLE